MRTLLAVFHDLLAIACAWMLAYWLRFNFEVPPFFIEGMITTLPLVVLTQAVLAWAFGLYRGLWRFASLPDLRRIALACGSAALVLPLMIYMLQWRDWVPRSVLVLFPLFLMLMMGGSRLVYRSWKDGELISWRAVSGTPVLVLGAGEAAVALLRELKQSVQWHVVGLLDDDVRKRGALVHGVPVLGPLHEVVSLATRHAVHEVILALPTAAHTLRRELTELATRAGLQVLTVPAFDDLLSGRVTISQVRRVELEDLLGRDRVELDESGLQAMLGGEVVLVSGAAGSIGSELCRQIARYAPRLLVCYEVSEFGLYQLEQQFQATHSGLAIVCAIGDVRDAARLQEVFGRYRPTVVFHAAAYKHVPLMENANAWQAVQNNVLGTWRVAQAALDHGVERFVLISTDKAVNPTNVMGASKRLAEMVLQALADHAPSATCFTMVRFGNVLGSSGSVVPLFRRQIAAGGPITLTHRDITRFFMTIPEAAQLVIQTGAMARGGDVFVLDMGEPVRIYDLACRMVELTGQRVRDTQNPWGSIEIKITGLRPGEKLYEELLIGEDTHPTNHPRILKAHERFLPWDELQHSLQLLAEQMGAGNHAGVRNLLKQLVEGYHPRNPVVDWVYQAQAARHTAASVQQPSAEEQFVELARA